ncbi:hypothetical protein LTR17_027466, partial [Elasticomyces elasticus]
MDPSAHTSASIDATLSSTPVPSSTSSNTMAYTSGIMIEYARANETSAGADIISDNAFVVRTINADVSTSPDYCDESQVVYEDRTEESSITAWTFIQGNPMALPYPDSGLSLLGGAALPGGQSDCQYSYDSSSNNGGVLKCDSGLRVDVTCVKRDLPWAGVVTTSCQESAVQTFLPLVD